MESRSYYRMTVLIYINVTWGKMRQRGITKQLSCYRRKSVKFIFSLLEAKFLNHKSTAFLTAFVLSLKSYFWGNDCFFLFLMKRFGHFNLSILWSSFHFKWAFLVNTKTVVIFSVVLCEANEISEFSLGEWSSSIMLFSVKWNMKQK